MFRWIPCFLAIFLLTSAVVEAETKTFTWEMSYISASPNGVERPVIGVNGQFPPPTIFVSKNDQVVIQVTNSLNDSEFVTLHTHGIFQNGTNYFDGVNQFTQWSSIPGRNLIIVESPVDSHLNISFNVGEQTGTYWIHSHVKGQYPNGLRSPFIVLDPDSPYHCDEQLVLSVSDWVSGPPNAL